LYNPRSVSPSAHIRITFPSFLSAMQSIHLRQETFPQTFRLAVWPIQPPVARVPGLFTEGKAAGAWSSLFISI